MFVDDWLPDSNAGMEATIPALNLAPPASHGTNDAPHSTSTTSLRVPHLQLSHEEEEQHQMELALALSLSAGVLGAELDVDAVPTAETHPDHSLWTCAVCTYDNVEGVAVCDMCGSERESGGFGDDGHDDADSGGEGDGFGGDDAGGDGDDHHESATYNPSTSALSHFAAGNGDVSPPPSPGSGGDVNRAPSAADTSLGTECDTDRGWVCGTCTFENTAHEAPVCGMCGSARVHEPGASGSQAPVAPAPAPPEAAALVPTGARRVSRLGRVQSAPSTASASGRMSGQRVSRVGTGLGTGHALRSGGSFPSAHAHATDSAGDGPEAAASPPYPPPHTWPVLPTVPASHVVNHQRRGCNSGGGRGRGGGGEGRGRGRGTTPSRRWEHRRTGGHVEAAAWPSLEEATTTGLMGHEAAPSGRRTAAGVAWSCSLCTFENPGAQQHVCAMCGTPRE